MLERPEKVPAGSERPRTAGGQVFSALLKLLLHLIYNMLYYIAYVIHIIYIILYCIGLYFVILYFYYVVLCYVMLCYAMLCYIVLYYVTYQIKKYHMKASALAFRWSSTAPTWARSTPRAVGSSMRRHSWERQAQIIQYRAHKSSAALQSTSFTTFMWIRHVYHISVDY